MPTSWAWIVTYSLPPTIYHLSLAVRDTVLSTKPTTASVTAPHATIPIEAPLPASPERPDWPVSARPLHSPAREAREYQ